MIISEMLFQILFVITNLMAYITTDFLVCYPALIT
jgi:hypothetical protein